MYSSLGITNSKHSGDLMGTHQKLDRAARLLMKKYYPKESQKFPGIDEVLRFEGSGGPDGLKRKSPGVDEPEHFIEPDNDDGKIRKYLKDHHYNLSHALADGNLERVCFEAAWMAHAATDGLTPAHHFPYRQVVDELMSDKDYKKLFGVKIKGIMRGDTLLEAARNNWLYWGAGGVMTKHIAFEYGVAYTITPIPPKFLMRRIKRRELSADDYLANFYSSLGRVASLGMYDQFLDKGWNTQLIMETREILIPEIIKTICICWVSATREAEKIKAKQKKRGKKDAK